MAKVEMYTKTVCPYCVKAKELLSLKGAEVIEYNIEIDPSLRDELKDRLPSARTVPQIFIDDNLVGGCDDLYALNDTGELDRMLKINTKS